MRVIGGSFRSRLLEAPRGHKTRPTSDRLRETLFNVLAPRIAGAEFVDLYAGSGAVGIEALSRGAGFVYFAESATPALAVLRGNLKALGVHSGFAVEPRKVAAALRRWSEQQVRCDIFFLDPPYEEPEEYAAALGLLGGECRSLLRPEAVVIAEHRKRSGPAERFGQLERYRVLEQGDAALSFYRVEASEEIPEHATVTATK